MQMKIRIVAVLIVLLGVFEAHLSFPDLRLLIGVIRLYGISSLDFSHDIIGLIPFVISILLMISGIGILFFKKWVYYLLNFTLITYLIAGVCFIFYILFFVYQLYIEQPPIKVLIPLEKINIFKNIIFTVFEVVIIPIFLIIFFRKDSVRNQFR